LDEETELTIAVVSHGLFLAALWKMLLLKFKPLSVSLGPEVLPPGPRRPLEYMPAWSNTGFLELDMRQSSSDKPDGLQGPQDSDAVAILGGKLNATIRICAMNSKNHLTNLKRTRGGVGSSASDDKQKRLETFFKKTKNRAHKDTLSA